MGFRTDLEIRTSAREELIDITREVNEVVGKLGLKRGCILAFVPHTTAGLLINEAADPAVGTDILNYLRHRVPHRDGYLHAEGNSDAHIKASLIGNSQLLMVDNGEIVLGTWQGLFFAEFDGPRLRKILFGNIDFTG
ncbi:MAG: YjbQ family protein [Firmicutes bacterium]|jgi:secondary thiamine-phosphate synthase enzyme|nr:YjbQ family protein [Bacillota bacterium]